MPSRYAKLSPERRKASYSERNKKRWQTDRSRALATAIENAKRGSAALTGSHYTPERSRRHSIGQQGKIMGGLGAKGPGHYFAKTFSLIAPDGVIFRGENILEFVRSRQDLFSSADLRMRSGTCNAAKALCALRPGSAVGRRSWKGWAWCMTGPNEL
jgi:hypothetical protein